MLKTLSHLPLLFALSGCAESKSLDTAQEDDASDADGGIDETPCSINVRVDAVSVDALPDPAVGESWTLLMYCDDSLLMGPAVLSITPADLASLDPDMPTFTFLRSGEGEILYQVGNRKAEIPVTVTE